MDAISLLKEDHRQVDRLFREIERAKGKGMEKVAPLVEQVLRELTVHSSLEKSIVYPAFRKAPGANELILQFLEEHHLVAVVMQEIEGLDMRDERMPAKIKLLKDLVQHHFQEEEAQLFPQAREICGEDRLKQLGEQIEEAKPRLQEKEAKLRITMSPLEQLHEHR
jgi:hemerythrin superfamily protein